MDRTATHPAMARYTRGRRNRRRNPSHAHVPRSSQGAGHHQPSLRPVLRDGPRRPWRRRGQGRTPRRRGRHAKNAAVRGRRECAVHALEPKQALGGARPEIGGGPRHLQGDGRGRGRRDRELQAGYRRAARDRLRSPVRAQPPARLLLDLRIRPHWPVCSARRLRPHRLRHVRTDEHQRTRRGPAVPHPDSDHRPRGRAQRRHWHPRRPRRSRADRPRPACRHLPVRVRPLPGRVRGGRGLRDRRSSRTARARAPRQRSVPALPHRRRLHQHRLCERPLLGTDLRGARLHAAHRGPTLCDQAGSRQKHRCIGRGADAVLQARDHRALVREARSGRGSGGAGDEPRRSALGPALPSPARAPHIVLDVS